MSQKRFVVLVILLVLANLSKPEDITRGINIAVKNLMQVSREEFSTRRMLGEIFGGKSTSEGRSLGFKSKNGVEQFFFEPTPRNRIDQVYRIGLQNGDTLTSVSYYRFFYRKRGVRLETLRRELTDELSGFFGEKPVYRKSGSAIWEHRIYDGSTRTLDLHMSITPLTSFGMFLISGLKNCQILSSKKESIAISLRIDLKLRSRKARTAP